MGPQFKVSSKRLAKPVIEKTSTSNAAFPCSKIFIKDAIYSHDRDVFFSQIGSYFAVLNLKANCMPINSPNLQTCMRFKPFN